jgi:hypothetical protein
MLSVSSMGSHLRSPNPRSQCDVAARHDKSARVSPTNTTANVNIRIEHQPSVKAKAWLKMPFFSSKAWCIAFAPSHDRLIPFPCCFRSQSPHKRSAVQPTVNAFGVGFCMPLKTNACGDLGHEASLRLDLGHLWSIQQSTRGRSASRNAHHSYR